MSPFRLAALELRRFRGHPARAAALAAVVLLPLVCAGLYLWSAWDPHERLDRLPVAVVNRDTGATITTAGDTTEVNGGDQLVAQLKRDPRFDWRFTGPDTARDGLARGHYYLVVTVPDDFSTILADDGRAHVRLDRNPAGGHLAGAMAASVERELRQQVDTAVHRVFTDMSPADTTTDAVAPNATVDTAELDVPGPGVAIDTTGPDHHGRGLAPHFIAVALWIFGLLAYLLLRPANPRALAGPLPAAAVATAGWLPAAVLGAAAALALFAVVFVGLGLDPVDAPATAGLCLLVVWAFSAVAHLCRLAAGAAGSLLVVVLLVVQLTSAGGLYPVATLPGFFAAVHPWLPMTYAVEGLRAAIDGGGSARLWPSTLVLGVYLVASLAAASLVVAARRQWTMDRLHPPLGR